MLRFLSLWLPVIAYMAALFYLSSPGAPSQPPQISDKTLHVVGYGGLALVTLRAVAGGRWSGVTWSAVVIAWAIAALYGVTDEIHQMFTAGRSPELADVGADALGAAAAVGACGIIRRLTP